MGDRLHETGFATSSDSGDHLYNIGCVIKVTDLFQIVIKLGLKIKFNVSDSVKILKTLTLKHKIHQILEKLPLFIYNTFC